MDAPAKAPDKKPAASPPSETLGEAENLQLPNIQTTHTLEHCSKKENMMSIIQRINSPPVINLRSRFFFLY